MKENNRRESDVLNVSAPTNLTLAKGVERRDAKKSKSVNGASNVKANASGSDNRSSNRSAKNKPNAHGGGKSNAKNRVGSANDVHKTANRDSATANFAAKKSESTRQNRNSLRNSVKKGKLKVMFLGGVGEIGKNMTVFEYGDSIVVIDAGMTFPGSDMPGVDVVIPDFSYLVQNRSKIKAILLTHGHEDHIGAIPFLVEKLGGKLDIYGTKLTLALVENKLVEHGILDKVNLITLSDKSIVTLADFTVEFIHVSHSVAGSVAICLRTPVGVILHTGDFKIDYTPLGNEIMNLNRIAEIGKQGVLLLMSESTNVEKPGYTLSESVVEETLNKVFHDAKGRRIIVATFASNVDRLGMIIDLARLYKRKIAVSGRSMVKYIETAQRVGQMTVDNSMFVDIDRVNSVEDGKLVILSTGSQGEPMSALTRMASGEFNKVKVGKNDTIVISATPIPGNEKDVYNVINKLYRLGAVVVYSALSAVHVSGHACQEELKLIYTLVKPKYFIPVHGEYRHLKQHAMLVEKLGHKSANVIIPDIGDCVEVDNATFKLAGTVAGGSVMVDGLGVGDVGNVVLRDRLNLAEDGFLVCAVGIDVKTKKVVTELEVTSRGCFFEGDADNTGGEIKRLIAAEVDAALKNGGGVDAVKTAIYRTAKHYFRVNLKRNPMVLALVLQV
ncbi:MAG: ribonuclease J [Corallococcus sp.]|nr:ribonuclease J [Corallococcus sp.]MCM1359655.1 ribonuclease J [Corallococcus sp.]MCM1395364.1 ribonuclease J [Corallococcus sp.]